MADDSSKSSVNYSTKEDPDGVISDAATETTDENLGISSPSTSND